MAVSIRAVQTAIAFVNVLLFALVFTSVWPFPSGDFDVNLPSPNEVVWGYEDGVVTVSAPYSIDNGGFYDVDDLLITYEVTNYTDEYLVSGEIDIGTLPAGQVTADSIEFTFPLLEMYESGADWMVFNDDFLYFSVDVSCYYTMKLVHFYAQYNVSVPWDALIREVAFDGASTEGTQLLVDYHVITSDVLEGTTSMHVYLYDGATVVAHEAETVVLGRYHAGTLVFDLPLSAVPDRVVLSVQIYEFTVTETIAFDPGWIA